MITYKPDRAGVAQILKVTTQDMVRSATNAIADNVRAADPDLDVAVNFYVTDRFAGSVTIREPQGRLLQVRDGILTRAAAAAGAEVRAR